jgi:hypothetical protein
MQNLANNNKIAKVALSVKAIPKRKTLEGK